MGSMLFKPSVYMRLAAVGGKALDYPRDLLVYQEPADNLSKRINAALLKIFEDVDLHAAVRAYGQRIPFAHYAIDDKCYNGFVNLALDPHKAMVLVRQELAFMADSASECEIKDYPLFQREGKIFYASRDTQGKRIEAVLASNDMTGQEFTTNWDSKYILGPKQILKSLEKAIGNLTK